MRPDMNQQNERCTDLYEAILRLENLDECIRFFDDLCAVTELRTMEQRYAVAGCLLQGKVYSEIRRETGASSARQPREPYAELRHRQRGRQRQARSGAEEPRGREQIRTTPKERSFPCLFLSLISAN